MLTPPEVSNRSSLVKFQVCAVLMLLRKFHCNRVCAGPAEEVKALVKELDTEGIFARALDTNGVPYHSPQLDPLLKELESSKHLPYTHFLIQMFGCLKVNLKFNLHVLVLSFRCIA